jgi:sphingolipid delta-4 desaturase
MASEKKMPAETTFQDPYRPNADYVRVKYHQPHWERKKLILQAHPEVRDLFGPDNMSFVYTVAMVGFMVLLAYALKDANMWVVFMVAYCVGAVVDHALWVLIHEGTHNLVFEKATHNLMYLLLANLPHVYPTSITFRYYHMMHHSHLNETYMDPDLPGVTEAKLFGNSVVGKIIWLMLFPAFQALRTLRFSKQYFDRWVAANYVIQILFDALILYLWGWTSIIFLFLSSLFAIGLHPLGARWIAEHYSVHPNQETYSYYGWGNIVTFNIGYHNEHHDLVKVAWSRLPKLTKIASEFYSNLYIHETYTELLLQFFSNSDFTLRTRVVRDKNIQ